MRYLVQRARNNLVHGMAICEVINKLKIDTSTDKSQMHNNIKFLDKNTFRRMRYKYNAK